MNSYQSADLTHHCAVRLGRFAFCEANRRASGMLTAVMGRVGSNMRGGIAVAMAVMLSADAALPLTLNLPGTARVAAEAAESFATYRVPIGPFANDTIRSILAEGAVRQQAFRIEDSSLTTLQILDPLRTQLVEDGFRVLFQCETRACGGFDFRYQVELLPEPDMHVDLGDFRFLSLVRGGGETEPEYLSLMVSRSQRVGFVHVSHIAPRSASTPVSVTSTKAIAPEVSTARDFGGAVISQLEDAGTSTLEDLVFPSGSSELGSGAYDSLAELAAFLNADASRRVLLVGHTDAVGSLEANIALSRRRAESVVRRLVREYGVRAAQIDARGIGYMAPRASNRTDEGRGRNRRVEVVLTSIE